MGMLTYGGRIQEINLGVNCFKVSLLFATCILLYLILLYCSLRHLTSHHVSSPNFDEIIDHSVVC